jgi:hypothetical protein
MTEESFEHLWEQAAAAGPARRIAAGYPVWQRRQRQRRNAVLSIAAVFAVGVTLWLNLGNTPKVYDTVACNKAGYSAEYWVQVANEMLTTEV